MDGCLWCYEGVHTTLPIPDSDLRRVLKHAVVLTASPRLQDEIDALPVTVETLTITTEDFALEEEFKLAKHLPNLKELQLMNVGFSEIMLTEDLTPSLSILKMENVPSSNECDLRIECP